MTGYEFDGVDGRIYVTPWGTETPRFVVVLAHGYGEHAGRYEHVASTLTGLGATVYAPDHLGHGRSAGEPALVTDIEMIVSDLHAVADRARRDHPALPFALIGHSMGGLIATRFAQRYGDELAALVLSGPLVGGNPMFAVLLGMETIPDIPIDPSILSRDPAVGAAYADDPLVYHGPLLKTTLLAFADSVALVAGAGRSATCPRCGSTDRPTPRALRRHRRGDGAHRRHGDAAHRLRGGGTRGVQRDEPRRGARRGGGLLPRGPEARLTLTPGRRRPPRRSPP